MEQASGGALWSVEALADLVDVWRYYFRTAGPDTAEKVVREIQQVANLLAEHPKAGRSRYEIRAGVRSIAAPPHVLFYRIESDIPQIVRVLDGRRDIETIFATP